MDEYMNDIDGGRRDYEMAHAEEIANARVTVTHESNGEPVIRESDSGKVVSRQQDKPQKSQTSEVYEGYYNQGYQDGYAAGFNDGGESVKAQGAAKETVIKEVVREVPVQGGDISRMKLFRCSIGGREVFCLSESMGRAIARVSEEYSLDDIEKIDHIEILK